MTQVIPFDLVDVLLDETRCVQLRLRDLPSRVGVYFLFAMCLFPEVGYRLVWGKLTAALTGAGLEVAAPTAKALRDLRRRVGTEPMRHLFRGPGRSARRASNHRSTVRAVPDGFLRRLRFNQDPRQ
ncbi:transposase domain-containing protein [Streptomyces sp. BA2]|uniref:transposase domain-containing protein n=1 Tax=Streptomyces sp. BA2 TaxID=436595 RepID=UPI00136FE577